MLECCVCVLCSGAGAINIHDSLDVSDGDGNTALIIKGDTTFASNSAGGDGGEIHLLLRCDPAVRISVDGVAILLVACVCLDKEGGGKWYSRSRVQPRHHVKIYN